MKTKNTYKKLIGSRILKIRMELGMTQAEFAQAAGIGQQHTISGYERGHMRPNLSSVTRILLLTQKHNKRYTFDYLYPELKRKGVSNG